MNDPWHHPMRWTDLGREPRRLVLTADAGALVRIAEALELPAVKRFTADLTVRPWLDGAEITGRLDALVTQTCGVSLEDFDAEVADEFVVRVLPAGSPNAQTVDAEEMMLDPEAEDPPDVIEGDALDLGHYAVEHLALALDPFPRKPGVEFEPPPEDEPESPFAALRALKEPSPKR